MAEINIPVEHQPKLEFYLNLSKEVKFKLIEKIKSSPLGLTSLSFAKFLSEEMPISIENIISITDYPLPVELDNHLIAYLPIELSALREEITQSQYILQFEDNWDGEGSEMYRTQTWINAVSFICNYANWVFDTYKHIIPIPNIYHGPNGSIDLYWEKDTFNLLINLPKEDNGVASFYGDDYATQRVEGHFNPLKFQTLLLPSLIQF